MISGTHTLTGRRTRRGFLLLEAVLAVALVGVVSLALLSMALDAHRAVRVAAKGEDELRQASALLDAVALWRRETLDQRLGARRQGRWLLAIERQGDRLYAIELLDSIGRRPPILATILYREPGES